MALGCDTANQNGTCDPYRCRWIFHRDKGVPGTVRQIDLRLPTRDGSVSQRYWKPVVIS